ncbi:Signal transduction histidine-protein kinase BaeS [Hydrogenovibrio crunogenus]|uniref:histidine kinase n=1 Tax=Hydrogenovibrio crunogenus TaxID=39765 RepID=A0A4P7NYV5_9GAMM|nr:ATP-binding protein [Hydrogenovibrio crunogenus]QBZ82991.1 Signal transduction histidine-protein kinase BaeS [Hydrogenovibrio crunogenus]
MTLRLKLILVLLGFGFLMLEAMMWSNQYLLHNTMVKYVDKRDQLRLERLKNNIEVYMDEKGVFDTNDLDLDVWQRLLTASHRVDLTHTYIPMDILLEREYPKMLQIHPDEFESRVSLISKEGQVIIGPEPTKNGMEESIIVDREEVGQLGYNHRDELTEKTDIEFTEDQSMVFTWGAVLMTGVALLLLLPFASHFLSPIRKLTLGMRKLSQGQFATRLQHDRKDEFGQLQQDFNYLAASLEKSQQSRNQWIADISHELRTPLTILQGSLEAIKDGIRPANETNLQQIHEEVLWLNRLVDDLYQVTLNDIGGLNYKMNPVDFKRVVTSSVAMVDDAAQEKGLRLSVHFSEDTFKLNGDESRLQQLVTNLLWNSIAYTDAVTASGEQGQVIISLSRTSSHVIFSIEDSAPSVNEDEIPYLFERLYRTEGSRNRRHGGAGLGLAIVQQIVEAHMGKVSVAPSELGGIKVSVKLPV